MRLGICLQPALAFDYAHAHVCLRRLGYPAPSFDRILRQSRSSPVSLGRERVPHRVLEQNWIEQTWQHSEPVQPTQMSRVAADSVLNNPMDLLQGSRDDGYAFAHALMCMSGFKGSPPHLPRQSHEVLMEAEAMLARCVDEQDHDLGGEILLTWPLTGEKWSAVSTFGFQILISVEDSAGFLPSPITRIDRLQNLDEDHRAVYLSASAYHTAFVMGLLCAAALLHGRTPPARIPILCNVDRGADRALALLGGATYCALATKPRSAYSRDAREACCMG